MHTTMRKKDDGMTLTINAPPQRANILPIGVQIAHAAISDDKRERRRIKAARKRRQWKE